MPRRVDREAVRGEIVAAFQRCIDRKPLDKVSIRDIAAEAGMKHPTLLNYFASKDEIINTYIRYTKDFMSSHCMLWFKDNERRSFASDREYINAFMQYVAEGKEGELRPNAAMQVFVLGHYDQQIGEMVREEFREWHETVTKCLVEACGSRVGENEAEALMALIVGTMVLNYNQALTGKINHEIPSLISKIVQG